MPKSRPKIERSQWSAIPFMPKGVGPQGYTTKLSRGRKSVEGSGWTKKAADRNAGRKWSS